MPGESCFEVSNEHGHSQEQGSTLFFAATNNIELMCTCAKEINRESII